MAKSDVPIVTIRQLRSENKNTVKLYNIITVDLKLIIKDDFLLLYIVDYYKKNLFN